ncbi:MAG: glycoside hydrolase family 2 protein [Burkholderiaceae bacterium]|nr:MAG: glycoside hydrolase family 2 protein [Burkholderiaceae bacterium]
MTSCRRIGLSSSHTLIKLTLLVLLVPIMSIASIFQAQAHAEPARSKAITQSSMKSQSTKQVDPQEQQLHTGWQFRIAPEFVQGHTDLQNWRTAQVPGHIHTDLLQHNLIQDPYVGMAEADLQWIGKVDWEYQLRFDLDASRQKHAKKFLQFDGIDTFAEVRLNGEKLMATDNAFRSYQVDVSHKLKARDNLLEVRLASPIDTMLPRILAMPHKLAGNYPSPYGDEPKDAMTANFVRKPGYHYGWDWGPRYVTAGIWRPVKLITYDVARIEHLAIKQKNLNQTLAELEAEFEIALAPTTLASRDQALTLEVQVIDPDGRTVFTQAQALSKDVSINPSSNNLHSKLKMPLQIQKPRRWYPRGYGQQALYKVKSVVKQGTVTVAEKSQSLGLRTVELDRRLDEPAKADADLSQTLMKKPGQAFGFVINSVPVFAKGANLIPFDMFPNRISVDQQRKILQAARDANMNMLRIWGGGYYENDDFYRMADEMGIMIWQDFMFGGGVVPGYDDAFRQNVMEEARQQVQRLNQHPSIVLWCGNNEEETAWKDWGIGKEMQKANPDFAHKVWRGYQQLFGKDLRQVVQEHGLGVPYWSSSPSNDLDDKANDSERGDKHYWEVWGGSKPVEEYLRETPRFMSEFGLQAWPQRSTVDVFASREQQAIDHPVIRQHQKFMAGEGNARLLHYIRANYREPRDFDDFLYLSQVMQAEGITLAIKHHRASMPRTMGSMYWQLNDAWPGASWSSIDYFGNWKALHYQARKAFAPTTLVAENLDGKTTVFVVSDEASSRALQLRWRVMDFDGKVLGEEYHPVQSFALGSMKVVELDNRKLLDKRDPRQTFLVLELSDAKTLIASEVVYFEAAKNLKLTNADVKMRWRFKGEYAELQLSSATLVRMLSIETDALKLRLSDNYFDLLPQQNKVIRISKPPAGVSWEQVRKQLKLRYMNQ